MQTYKTHAYYTQNILKCAEQVQIQKYKTHAYNTQLSSKDGLKEKVPIKPKYHISADISNSNHIN